MSYPTASGSRPRSVDAARLWMGGAAAALVALLVAVTGILLIRGVLGIPILAPEGAGVWGNASLMGYAGAAAFATLLATALAHLLVRTTPRPMRFFGWIVGLVTVIGVVLPLSLDVDLDAKLATATLNGVLGIAIYTLVSAVARSTSHS
ncbi:DUF6069 family protein [Ornithinimicrobium sp. F0845]|uniref:DUF6069 family protein n=1 Tax=Ornithinimicrobium sp. F0845 TaxID=2926412 RepID=UPI001FF1C469|nr:DUF6069 family protein [Ornithinimicrobium sp. F0845]MCK0113587.1 DUF6069 family protein [Ornithinimicrobium sp. F0845]